MQDGEFQKNIDAMEAESQADTNRLLESGERAGEPVTPKEADFFRRGFQAGWVGHLQFQSERHKDVAKEIRAKKAELQKQLREIVEAEKSTCLERLRTHLSKTVPLTRREEEIFNFAYRQADRLHQPPTAAPVEAVEPPVGLAPPEPSVN